MNCTQCGQPLAEGAKFCPNCGTRAEQRQSNAFCSTCGTKLEPSARFCPVCGVKIGQTVGQTEGMGNAVNTMNTVNTVNTGTSSGRLLISLKMVSMYEGTPAVGIAKASGSLSVYDDRIEFKKQLGNSMGYMFGFVGMAMSQSKVNKDPVDIYPVSQIAQLRVGKYGGVYNTLVVVLRDGATVSFCPAAPGSSAPQNIINNLQPYLR